MVFGLVYHSQAQKHYDYNWAFGYGTGIYNDTNYFGGAIMSFNGKLIHFFPQHRSFDIRVQSNTYSDKLGEFLYLSNGCSLRDKFANNLKGADTIGYGDVWSINCPNSNNVVQAGLFIPTDDSTINYIYLVVDTIGLRIKYKYLLSAKIYIPTDSLMYKDRLIIQDTLYHGLHAIPAIDANKWWIICPQYNVNKIWTFLITGDGVIQKIENVIGNVNDSLSWGAGQGFFSPDGRHYALYSPNNGLQVFDFDRLSGTLNNFRYFKIIYSNNVLGGCSFSPDSRFVYVCNPTEVLQVDLQEPDSTKAIDTVGVFDNFFEPYPTTYLQMALGPDCRIYISTYGGNRYLHVIMYPNNKGKACQLINRGLKLPSRNSFAIPNNPHYRVDDPYPCDSTIAIHLNVGTQDQEEGVYRSNDLMIYPIPAEDLLHLQLLRYHSSESEVFIYDIQGRMLSHQCYLSLNDEQTIDVSRLYSGIYFIMVRDRNGKRWMERFVKR